MIKENKSLEGFEGFEEMSSEVDFFSQTQDTDVSTDTKSVIDEISKDDISSEENKNVEVTSATEKDDLFSDKTILDDNEEEEAEVKTDSNISILNKLKEKGFIEFELEEGEELTEELAEELLEDKFEESVENKVKELVNDLPDEKKQAVQYLLKGGSLTDLISAFSSNDVSIDLNINLEKEETQISTLKKLLKLEDKDDEEIETEIEFLKDSGKLKLITEKKFNKYKKEIEEDQRDFLAEQEDRKEKERIAIRESKAKISTFLTKNVEVDGITFTKEDKKSLPSYMNDKTVKLQNGTLITEMQKQLFYDIPKNDKALIQLATLLKNRNEDGTFNFDSIAKSARTKVTQEVRKEIRRGQSIPGNSTITGKESVKSLADYFTK